MSTASPAPSPAWSPMWRMSVSQFDRLVASDVLTEDDAVELIEGWLVKKMPASPAHDTAVTLTQQSLAAILPDDWYCRIQSAIETEDSKPEPDIAVVRAPATRYGQQHPRGADVGLLVEVADTSLSRDRHKADIYAAAGVPCYWIVNLSAGELECFDSPDPTTGSYQAAQVLQTHETATVVIDGQRVGEVRVDSLLP